jgi:NADH dehydrogenase [ubiquinone] 1 alpha subcomplex assembly factor 1
MESIRLVDFTEGAALAPWRIVDDRVMGGISRGNFTLAADHAAFHGHVTTESNGGFSSIRGPMVAHDLSGWGGITVHVKGDGHIYTLTLRTDQNFDGVYYRHRFTPPAGEWASIHIPFTEFEPVFRGRKVPTAPPLDPARLQNIGFMISENQVGQFRLEIQWIGASREVKAESSETES